MVSLCQAVADLGVELMGYAEVVGNYYDGPVPFHRGGES